MLSMSNHDLLGSHGLKCITLVKYVQYRHVAPMHPDRRRHIGESLMGHVDSGLVV
jgi:hypothetical protein